uniref:NADH-ubiquinone oxidoreductase chain 3 n=1 Tax=Seira pallidipes TaxID=3053390 RepID=A0AAU6QDP1_9HEXA
MFIIFTFAILISIILIIINSFISKKSFIDREKLSPFECGFDPKNNSRIPFSLRFYLIALIFLIFDVEITLILPFPILLKSMNLLPLMIMVSYFIFILIFGLFHEWNEGALEWSF